MPNGTFYAVSTGAGNPELLTLQAIRTLQKCDVIFYPETERNTIALDSLSELDLSQKSLVPCRFSMTSDKAKSDSEYEIFAKDCARFLSAGKSVAFVSIGDVSLYSSASHAARVIQDAGFETRFVAGVNSFSEAAAVAKIPLAEKNESLSILPADFLFKNGTLAESLKTDGTKVLMKMGRHLCGIISLLSKENLIQNATLVQKASLPDEKNFRGEEMLHLSEKDFETAYLSVIIVKN